MRPDAALLKEILDCVADISYSRNSVSVDDLQISDVPKDKLIYHVEHLIKEGYLDGLVEKHYGVSETDILIQRMTEKGALFLDTTKNPEFLY